MAPGCIGVVVTGDSHLSPYLPRLTPQRRAERRERLRKAFGQAVDYAVRQGAALFIQCGDLFDTPTPANADRAYVASCLARLRENGIICVAIGGNHDTPRMQTEQDGASPLRVYEALGGLRYFSRSDVLAPQLIEINGLRLAVAGLSNNPVAPPGSDPLFNATFDDPTGILAAADV